MDDEEVVRDIAERMLTKLGYEITCAKDGMETLELVRYAKQNLQPYQVIILDLSVPGGMGGKETMKQLMNIAPETKVLVSSGYLNDPIMENYRLYGFDGIVKKPYKMEELCDILAEVLA